jgi:hypothetical protein
MSISINTQGFFPADENDRGEVATASGISLHVLMIDETKIQ